MHSCMANVTVYMYTRLDYHTIELGDVTLTLSLKAREFFLIPELITGADESVPIAPIPTPEGRMEGADETTRVGRVPLPLRRRTTCE